MPPKNICKELPANGCVVQGWLTLSVIVVDWSGWQVLYVFTRHVPIKFHRSLTGTLIAVETIRYWFCNIFPLFMQPVENLLSFSRWNNRFFFHKPQVKRSPCFLVSGCLIQTVESTFSDAHKLLVGPSTHQFVKYFQMPCSPAAPIMVLIFEMVEDLTKLGIHTALNGESR